MATTEVSYVFNEFQFKYIPIYAISLKPSVKAANSMKLNIDEYAEYSSYLYHEYHANFALMSRFEEDIKN